MHIKHLEDLSTFARERRKELGWNQKDLAEKAGVNRWWIIDFERGKPTVELRLVLATLNALNLELFLEEKPEDGDETDLDELFTANLEDDEL
tara:strand:+ start:266 stop:541 length:276 start_codon:yes stop_codon:yes gene_type:complete